MRQHALGRPWSGCWPTKNLEWINWGWEMLSFWCILCRRTDFFAWALVRRCHEKAACLTLLFSPRNKYHSTLTHLNCQIVVEAHATLRERQVEIWPKECTGTHVFLREDSSLIVRSSQRTENEYKIPCVTLFANSWSVHSLSKWG